MISPLVPVDRRLISVIIPVLNEEHQIAATLALLEPTMIDGRVEVIAVDGGSGDRTVELLLKYCRQSGRARLVEYTRANRGGQMNAGAQIARGDILLFLHADVRLPATAFDEINRSINFNGNFTGSSAGALTGPIGGCFQIVFPIDSPSSLHLVARGINLRTRLFRTATGDQAIFVRHDVFNEMGGYRDLPLMEDIVFFNELKRRGRVEILDSKVEISPRRWLRFGVWRTVLLMYILRIGYWIGISPVTLKRYFLDVR